MQAAIATLSRRSSLDHAKFGVVVCGGGSAGIAASAACARLGIPTLLVERYGYCGGATTAAMVHSLDAVRSCTDNGRLVVAGIALDLIHEVRRLGGLLLPDNPPETTVIHPDCMKVAADRLLRREGVTVLYYATAIGALKDLDSVRGVELALRDGLATVWADVVIDTTGDADVAYHAGAQTVLDAGLQALTCWFRLANVTGADGWRDLELATQTAMHDAYNRGLVQRFGGPWIIRLNSSEITVNASRVFANPVQPAELSQAEMDAREQVMAMVDILRRSIPALQNCYLAAVSSQLHIRESRKVEGDYMLAEQDVLSGARFEDSVALGAWPIDIHPTNGSVGVHPHKENPPEPYEIPYRCLLPKGLEYLLVAGKPISTTHRAHGSTRVQGTSFATGHAAGVAAALSCCQQRPPRSLDVRQIREALEAQGAICSVSRQADAAMAFSQQAQPTVSAGGPF